MRGALAFERGRGNKLLRILNEFRDVISSLAGLSWGER
jgi:hypothetical protein